MASTLEKNILNRIVSLCNKGYFPVIGIDGYCGSGKTTLAKFLKENLKDMLLDTVIVSLDNFMKPKVKREDFSTLYDYDIDRFKKDILIPLKDKSPIITKFYDWESDTFNDIQINPYKKIVIIEGVNSVNDITKDFFDFTIFLNVPINLRYKRVSKRGDFSKKEFEVWTKSEIEAFSDRDFGKYYDFVYNCN